MVACPKCLGKLHETGDKLVCKRCMLGFPVRDGVPQLVVEEAIDMTGGAGKPRASSHLRSVRFTERRQSGTPRNIMLEAGTCKVVGRPPSDSKTVVMHMDTPLILDEGTKALVQHYIKKQFSAVDMDPTHELGKFRRTSDLVLDDPSASRVHAMIFFDGEHVGILDLVSKNGTFVNGQEVESRLLSKGDVVEVGDSRLVMEGIS